jgi:hypothetical protein
MSPFDISMLAIPISLPMAILPGPSCMDCIMVAVLAIFSEVHFIISAEAGTDRNAEFFQGYYFAKPALMSLPVAGLDQPSSIGLAV